MITTNKNCYHASASDFKKIPGSPIAYWVSEKTISSFSRYPKLKDISEPKQGMATTNNSIFLKFWWEVAENSIGWSYENQLEASFKKGKWIPYSKGGPSIKWYGNNEYIVNFENDGETICEYIDNTPGVKVKSNGRVINKSSYYKEAITWSLTSSNNFSVRYRPKGFIFDVNGMSLFPSNEIENNFLLDLLNSKVVFELLKILNPTMAFQKGDIEKLPICLEKQKNHISVSKINLIISKQDWDSYETSWDFTELPLLSEREKGKGKKLKEYYASLRQFWIDQTLEMQKLEIENNRIFIDAYGLQDELTPEVPLNEITLTCNPFYRYGKRCENQELGVFLEDSDLEARLLEDTMKEFISYAVGCMFGRYSLDKPGLIIANQLENLEDYIKQISETTFVPDEDNILPILDDEWFSDDITERFKQFLKVTFGNENYEDNLRFIETALGKDIRKYFIKDFYNDHVKRYKKRPIYWLFSSPKGSFNVLIYMHRYKPDTVSKILNDYLRDFKAKLEGYINQQKNNIENPSATDKDKIKAEKEIDKVKKILHELEEYERDILYPLATQQIEIDLDDGVKVNYPKFGTALRKIPGLEDKEE